MRGAIFVGLALFALYMWALAPTIVPGDSGELVAAANCLGVAHPPGYPLYTLAGKIFLQIPAGAPAWRMNILSALLAASTAGLLYHVIRRITSSTTAALFGSLLLGLSPTFRSQATIAEVYPLALVLFLAVPAALFAAARGRGFAGAAYAAGTGAAHHPIGIFYLPVFALLALFTFLRGRRPSGRALLGAAILFILALSVILYLPIRARAPVPVLWGDPSSIKGMISHVGRFGYHDLPGMSDGGGVSYLSEAGIALRLLAGETGGPVLVLAAIGLFLLLTRRKLYGALAAAALLYGVFGLLLLIDLRPTIPSIESNRIFLQPAVLLVTGLAGVGFHGVCIAARARWIAFPLLLLLLAAPLHEGFASFDRSGNHAAADLGRLFLDPLEKNGTLRVAEGNVLFPIVYLQQVEGVRPDVRVESRKRVFRPVAPGGGPVYYSSREAAAGAPVAPWGIALRAVRPGESTPWKPEWNDLNLRTPPNRSLDRSTRELVFGFHLRYAANLAAAGRRERALGELGKAGALAGEAEEGMLHLGRGYHEAGFPDEALAIFRQITRDDSTAWKAYLFAGAILTEQGRDAEAREAFDQARRNQ